MAGLHGQNQEGKMANTMTCPCPKKKCPRHGDCAACRKHHSNTKIPLYCLRKEKNGGRSSKGSVLPGPS